MGRPLGRWARDEDGVRTGLPFMLWCVRSYIQWRNPKVSITVLKVGTVTTLSLPGTVTPSPLIERYLTPLRCPAGVQPAGPARATRGPAWRSRGGAEVAADGAMAAESRAASALPALAAEAS